MRALILISLGVLSFQVMAAGTCEGISRAPAVLEIEENFRKISSRVDNIEDDLFQAILECNKHDIKKAIKNGADIQALNDKGQSPLKYAKDVVGCVEGEEILSKKIKKASIALFEAVEACDTTAMNEAIKDGADVNATNDQYTGQTERHTVLTFAVKLRCLEAVKVLAPHPRIEINDQRSIDYNTALMIAARWNLKEIADVLIENKANLNLGSLGNKSALTIACNWGSTDVVKSLLARNDVDLNVNTTLSLPPLKNALGAALFMGRTELVDLILNHSENIAPMTEYTIKRAMKHADTEELRKRLQDYLISHPVKADNVK